MSDGVLTEETTEQNEAVQLSDEARTALEDLVKGCLQEEQAARRSEVRKAWQQRAFRNGIQHLWYDSATHCYMLPEASGAELPKYMGVYNIYTPHWRSFVSILSQNPPGVNFVPNDLQRGVDVTAASYAEKMRHRVDRLVSMKDRQMEAAGLFCTDGRTIAWTRVENGKLRVTMHGVLESKCPIFVRHLENWGYTILSDEVDIWQAKADYHDFAEKIKAADDTAGEASYERYARLMVLANRKGSYGGADGFKSLTTKHEAWIRPARFQKAPEGVRDELSSAFPEGVHATVISGVCVDAVPERMDDCLNVQWPAPGQGQNRPSMLHDLVPIQEDFNDILNLIREQGEYAIPSRWIADTVDSEAIAEQISAPGITHQITVPNGGAISDLVFVESPPALPPEVIANADRLLQLAQFTTGDLPSLFGEGTPDQETASGQKLLSDQAKGQLSPAWAGIQWLSAGVYEQAVKLAASLDPKETAIDSASGKDSFDPRQILDGEWGCFPDTDSSFPETMADKRASLQNVLTELGNAGEAGLSIVMQPDNLKLVKQFSGLTDLIIPGAEARDKQLEEIEQLLQEAPVPDMTQPPQIDGMTGQVQPPPMKSSVDVDPVWDYHQAEADKVQEWLSSRACREEQCKGNILGIQNVKLHGQAHKDALAKQQAQQATQQPMTISGNFKDLDPATKTQVLMRDGYQPDQSAYEVNSLQEQQGKAAETQDKAANAQHKAVLAAKEAVAPVHKPAPQPTGDGLK